MLDREGIDKETALRSLNEVGASKPVGYLPLNTVENVLSINVGALASSLHARGIRTRIVSPEDCCIESGAIYAYEPVALQRILDEEREILVANDWPTEAHAFVSRIAQDWLEPGDPVYAVIQRAFGVRTVSDASSQISHEIEQSGRLADNILYFARALRAAGIPVGPGAVLDALEALQVGGIGNREDFYWTLHAVFVKRHEHTILFDQAFRLFFRKRGLLEKMIASMLPETLPTPPKLPQAGAQRIQEAFTAGIKPREEERREIEVDARLTVSDQEILRKKDFAQMTTAEIAAAKQAIARLALPFDRLRTRRLVAARRGHLIDIRRTLRASLKAGGAVIDLKYLGPREQQPPLVALLDISGSMSQYTRLFLHFLHALTERERRVTTFLFGTRLTNVTRAIRARDPDEALAACGAHVVDWAGGTRIASSLREFNQRWSRRVLSQGAVVLLITDGLERDPDDILAFEMDRLHRSCRRLIWLNPLLRFAGFEARAKGVRTMLPHVDELRPIYNLESMVGLVRALSGRATKGYDPKLMLRLVA